MRGVRREYGFTLVEVLIALTILIAAAVPLLFVAAAAHRLARSQSEAADLQQRSRVVAEKLQRDLAMAGAGPMASPTIGRLADYLAPIVPARTGARLADPELTAFADRLTIFYARDAGSSVPLAVGMPSASSGMIVDRSAPGCLDRGLCGFLEGDRALIVDTSAPAAGYDPFTVTGILGEIAHDPPNPPLSRAYGAGAIVLPIVQRVYHFDRRTRRLMVYDGYQSDLPLVDDVVDLRFSYLASAFPEPGLRPLPLSELIDGPILGASPHRFDADLLRIRIVRVTLRLQAAADDVRGVGEWFARPGRSTGGYSLVPDFEVTFDVAPRNLAGVPPRPAS
jgi:type II secretory pathway pseudopilin PulG